MTLTDESAEQTTRGGLNDWLPYDMIRVTTEAHTSEELFPTGPHGRTLFYKHELIRVVSQIQNLCFAVPYLVDPDKVSGSHIFTSQFRELNPAERAFLGLPLMGGWDLVTRYGIDDAEDRARAERAARCHKSHWDERDEYGHCCDGGKSAIDPEMDPRKFTVGIMVSRRLDTEPRVTRELHPWPAVYDIEERVPTGTPNEFTWSIVNRMGRPMRGYTYNEMRAGLSELAAKGRGGDHVRVVTRVELPTPTDGPPPAGKRVKRKGAADRGGAIKGAVKGAVIAGMMRTQCGAMVPAGTRSFRFRVSRRGGNVGFVYVDIKDPRPDATALELARTHDDGDGGMEVYNRQPCPRPPCSFVSET